MKKIREFWNSPMLTKGADLREGAAKIDGGVPARMSDLFSPLALGDLELPNRIIMAPLTAREPRRSACRHP